MGYKKIWGLKKLGVKKNLGQTKFWVKIFYFVKEKILKKNLVQTNFGPKKMLSQKRTWSKKYLGSKIIAWSKKFRVQNNFQIIIIFSPKFFLDPNKFSGPKKFWFKIFLKIKTIFGTKKILGP